MQQRFIQSIISGAGFAAWQLTAFPEYGMTGTAIAACAGLLITVLQLLRSKIVLTILALGLAFSYEPLRIVLIDFYQNIYR